MLLLNHCAQVCSLFISSPSHVAEAFRSVVRTEILQFDRDLALIAIGRFEKRLAHSSAFGSARPTLLTSRTGIRLIDTPKWLFHQPRPLASRTTVSGEQS